MSTVMVLGLAVAAIAAAIWYLTYWPLDALARRPRRPLADPPAGWPEQVRPMDDMRHNDAWWDIVADLEDDDITDSLDEWRRT